MTEPQIPLVAARHMADAVISRATSRGLTISCSVVDARGVEICTLRMDGAPWFTAKVARAKARTSALMGRPSADMAGLNEQYSDLWRLIRQQLGEEATTLPGGLPVLVDDQVIGAVGVSGAHPDQDIECAEFGIADWLGTPPQT